MDGSESNVAMVLQSLRTGTPVLWRNDRQLPAASVLGWLAGDAPVAKGRHNALNAAVAGKPGLPLSRDDIRDAAARLERFAPVIAALFPATDSGIIESPLRPIPAMAEALGISSERPLLLKMDSHLPVAGSIKARGGVYEVLVHAEQLALEAGILAGTDQSYEVLLSPEARRLYSKHTIAVGSTGNLGLSIGITGRALGFNVTVHMSRDAREWKKTLLRTQGAVVNEYASDYSAAVAAGRAAAQLQRDVYFVDDEDSRHLFLGYAVAALRLPAQLTALGITVSPEQPLYVYLPCGVGGGPGGVTFGLKHVFGDAVRCWFAEPVEAPAVIAGLVTGKHGGISVQDLGLSNVTAADGLAVGRPSDMVCTAMDHLLDGGYTVTDSELFRLLRLLAKVEGIELEPSALAGMVGPGMVATPGPATHVVWATGGSMVPRDVMDEYLQPL